MTTSKARAVYVWVWLPDATEPVVAGRLTARPEGLTFNYGRSYLDRAEAIPLYEPELPLPCSTAPPSAARGQRR
jgi:serine/threonine-protein kinase HipA